MISIDVEKSVRNVLFLASISILSKAFELQITKVPGTTLVIPEGKTHLFIGALALITAYFTVVLAITFLVEWSKTRKSSIEAIIADIKESDSWKDYFTGEAGDVILNDMLEMVKSQKNFWDSTHSVSERTLLVFFWFLPMALGLFSLYYSWPELVQFVGVFVV